MNSYTSELDWKTYYEKGKARVAAHKELFDSAAKEFKFISNIPPSDLKFFRKKKM